MSLLNPHSRPVPAEQQSSGSSQRARREVPRKAQILPCRLWRFFHCHLIGNSNAERATPPHRFVASIGGGGGGGVMRE